MAKKKMDEHEKAIIGILKNLIKKTTVPREKSEIKWDLVGHLGHPHEYGFETEYKNNIYSLGHRHLRVWPAGHKLLPCESRGDEKGPDLLLNLDGRTLPKLFGDLHEASFRQNEDKFKEYARQRKQEELVAQERQNDEQKKAARNAEELLKDFL